MSTPLPHQQRVVAEKLDLDEKRDRLAAFQASLLFSSLAREEQERLTRQAHIMAMYSSVLGERIAAFTREATQ